MLWGGYNTDLGRLSESDFPTSALDLFHGIRSLLPLLAGFLAIIKLLAWRPHPLWALRGPMGLMALYTLVGLVSSIFLSLEPLSALYWGGQYASVLLVSWSMLSDSDSLERIPDLLRLNWIIAAAIAAGVLALAMFDPDVVLRPGGFMDMGGGGSGSSTEIFGMSTTRSTGVARYAAIVGLVALARLWDTAKRYRPIWSSVLALCVLGIVYLQARTALLAFLGAAFMLLVLRRGSRWLFLLTTCIGLLLFAFTGSYHAFWEWLTKGKPFDYTLTGRTTVWRAGWELFTQSPLLGFGFNADRIFLERQHMHDALLHALVQTGLFGTIPFVAGLAGAWILIFRLYLIRPLPGLSALSVEVPGVLAFFTVASVSESTFAYYGVAWILAAPCLAYLQALARRSRVAALRAALARSPSLSFRRPGWAIRSASSRGA
jgi:O-antigen ligase